MLLRHSWGESSHYINPDDVAKEIFGDWNNPDSVLNAAIECTKQRYDDLENGRNLVFETVFSSDEKLEFVRLAKSKCYFIRLFYICTDSPEINAARIMKRYIRLICNLPWEGWELEALVPTSYPNTIF